jgi:hypothetical protein
MYDPKTMNFPYLCLFTKGYDPGDGGLEATAQCMGFDEFW